MPDVTFRGSAAQFARLVGQVVAAVAGRSAPPRVTNLVRRLVLLPMAAELLRSIGEDFAVKSKGGTGADGVTWPPLAASTLRRRRAEGIEDADILHESGAMERSLSAPSGGANAPLLLPDGMPFRVFEAEPGRFTVGTTRYPQHHVGFGRVPARPLWDPHGRLSAAAWAAVTAAGVAGMRRVLVELCGG